MTAYIIDTETSGLTPPIEATEVAYQQIKHECITSGLASLQEGYSVFDILEAVFSKVEAEPSGFVGRFKPSKPIESKAAELTGITDELIKDCPPSSSFTLPEMKYFIAHNAVFDWGVLGRPNVKRICTKELSQQLFKHNKAYGLKNNKLSSLIEFFYPAEAEELLATSHCALQDIKLVYLLLLRIYEYVPESDFESLASCCTQGGSTSSYSKNFKQENGEWVITFGKHKGTMLKEVPKDYLRWVVRNALKNEEDIKIVKGFL